MVNKTLRKFFDHLRGEPQLDKLRKRGLIVGQNFKMMGGCIIDPSHCWHIEIGDDVTFAPRVHIIAHDASTKIHLGFTRIANVKIGDRVFIGAGSIILPGVTIGDGSIIGAGSIVTRDVPNGQLAAGSPAKVICSVSDYIAKQKLKMNDENCFDESYTLRQNFPIEKREYMKTITAKHKQSFVI
jgi:maltose O-acetyltransferase